MKTSGETEDCQMLPNWKVLPLIGQFFEIGILNLWSKKRVYWKYSYILEEFCTTSIKVFGFFSEYTYLMLMHILRNSSFPNL